MESIRIRELLQAFVSAPLSSAQLEQISIYIDLLTRWNARINLTAIRHPEEIVTRHFGESFFAARHLLPGAHLKPTPPSSGYAVREADASTRLGAHHIESPAKAKVVDLGSG